MKRDQIELISVTRGTNLGVVVVPSSHLTTKIPAVIKRNTNARITAAAEVCLRESAHTKITQQIKNSFLFPFGKRIRIEF